MARQLRIEYKEACYHILSRGNSGADIFLSDGDRKAFLSLLKEMAARFDMEIYAYVLMNNHYHLLLKTRKPNLSRGMQWLGTSYTRRFNITHSRYGHLFQGRFKSILVENDAYLLQLSLYIHRNPLRAKMVKKLADYNWSSYPCYAYKRSQSDLVDTRLILSVIGANDKHRAYREKARKYSDEKNRVWEDVKHGLIYGSESFRKQIRKKYLSNKQDKELPQLNKILKEISPEVLLEKCAKTLKCDIDAFKQAGRLTGEDKDKRDAILYVLWQTGSYSNSRIGELFGLTFSSVSRRVNSVKSNLEENRFLRLSVEKLRAKIKV